ncbi:MAG: acyl-CoA dehydrogenase [Desulfatibacillum sp.]|nr:acyl-CoA dehydrogenase [Desulfatibacillum sp.]
MAQQLVDRKDLDFVLWEQLDCEGEILKKYGEFKEFNKKTCDMIITEAKSLAVKELLPTMQEGDRQGVRFEDGVVKVPDSFHRAHKLLLEGEWQSLGVDTEMGGQGAPPFIATAVAEIFMAASWACISYASMGNGTSDMIFKYGTQEQKDMYIDRITTGEWGGTMLLTEPDAGTDVGALTTTAVKNEDGTYSLSGNKIFITNGEHDLCENIIHPVLARIEGDPPGTKGISIFIVPKFLVNPDGSLGERNDIICTGVEKKHGIKASATCQMSMGSKGNCVGFLLGQEREGIKIMFNMMNHARMGTGLQAMAYASASYLDALNYARERVQGRSLENMANPAAPPVTIINHPDVRRNLLWMKSYVSGFRSFFQYTSMVACKAALSENEEERKINNGLFELMTPLIKAYLSDLGYEVCVQGIQVFGGVGFCQDFLAEQYARDCKITSIYEGTSGIQAMDLLGRKLGMEKGKVFMAFMGEVGKTVAKAKEQEELKGLAVDLEAALNRLGETAMHLGKLASSLEYKTAFAHSLPFLYAMGDVIMAWMLLWRASVATEKLAGGKVKSKDESFYQGQVKTAEFFIKTLLPVTHGKMNAIFNDCKAAIEISEDGYGGL